MPLRKSILTSPEPFAVSVTLEEVGTGRTLDVRDSLFVYPYPQEEDIEADGAMVHNYWTTDPIIPGRTYRFTAVGPNGEIATATLPIPNDYAVSVAINTGTTPTLFNRPMDAVRVEGVDHLAFVRLHAMLRPPCPEYRLMQEVRFDIPEDNEGPEYFVPVSKIYGAVIDECRGSQVAERLDLWIVASGTPWPAGFDFRGTALKGASLPANVDGAVGYLGGVLTKLVPYEYCTFTGPEPIPPSCVLTYDDSKAMITGTIRDGCADLPLADASVRLEALTPTASGHRRIRTSPTSFDGDYRIAGLDAGEYALRVSHPHENHIPPADGAFPQFVVHTDTLTFAPGERASLDIVLQRVGPC